VSAAKVVGCALVGVRPGRLARINRHPADWVFSNGVWTAVGTRLAACLRVVDHLWSFPVRGNLQLLGLIAHIVDAIQD
jgi:hypothetical protein